MSKWQSVQIKDLDTTIKIGPHKWRHKKVMHWAYCYTCGIIAVNNAPTRKLCQKLCGTFWN
jgi:hypothetical protein